MLIALIMLDRTDSCASRHADPCARRPHRDGDCRCQMYRLFIKPHCPWQNGKVERFNRTLANEWAYRRPYDANQARAAALAPFIEHYNTERIHSAHGTTPAARVSPT